MTNKQREMFWLVGENNNGKNIVIVKTNTGKALKLIQKDKRNKNEQQY